MEYKEIGRYGMLRHHYLEEHQPILFWQLLLEGTLESHLVQVDAEAHEAVNSCVRRMAEAQGVTDGLKHRNPLEWAARMNAIKAAAEEAILPKFPLSGGERLKRYRFRCPLRERALALYSTPPRSSTPDRGRSPSNPSLFSQSTQQRNNAKGRAAMPGLFFFRR